MRPLTYAFRLLLIPALVGRVLGAPGQPPPEALIPGDTAECFAFYPQEDRCLVTRGGMNQRMQGRLPDSLPSGQGARRELFASLRSAILADLTQETFLASQAMQAPIKRDVKEEIRLAQRKWEASRRNSAPDSVFLRLYKRYADDLLRLQPDARLEILASTDSALIDSLWIQLRQGRRTAPWGPASMPLDKAPEELAARIKTAEPRQWQAPFRMSFGFILIRLVKRGNHAMPSLEEAAPALSFLAQRPSRSEAIPEVRVREYYASHRGEFARPDTIRLETGLQPLKLGKTVSRNFQTSMTDAAELPGEVRQALGVSSSLRPGDTLGPMQNTWGRWRFRVLEIRRGRDSIPFAEASVRIVAKLRKLDEESALRRAQDWANQKMSGQERALIQTALEEAYAPSAERMDSLVRVAEPSVLASYGCQDHSEECITGFKKLEGRRLAEQAVDSLEKEWIRTNVKVADPSSP